MKRQACIFISIVLCLVLNTTAYAKTYNLSDTDMSISMNDTEWYVFTRDNIENNPELEECGISYESMYDILYSNSAYMDAVLLYEDGGYTELFIRKATTDTDIINLTDYNNEDVMELAKILASDHDDVDDYSVYENNYKFARLEYIDSGYYICEFYTVINKEIYTLTFQSPSQFADREYDEIKKIVDSIKFDVDATIEEVEKPSAFSRIIQKAVFGAIGGILFGGCVFLITMILNKIKKRCGKDNENCHKHDSGTDY